MRSNFFYMAVSFYSMILYFIVGILVKRVVSPEIVGVFEFAASVGILFNMPGSVLRNGVERLIPKYLAIEEKQKANDVASLSLSFLIIVVILGGISLSLLGFFFRKDLWQLLSFPTYGIFFIFNSLGAFFFIYLKSLNNIKESAWLNFAKVTCFNLSFYICVFFMRNAGYYVGYIVGGLMAFGVSIYISFRYISWKNIIPSLHFSKILWKNELSKEIWKTGSLILFYGFLFQILLSIDKYFVKFLEGNSMLAFYSFAVRGTMVAVSLLSAFVASFSPKIYFNFAQGNDQEYLLKKITLITMVLAYIASFAIFTGADFFIELVLPNYNHSIPFLKIFTLMIIPFSQYNIGYIIAIGKNKVLPILKGLSILLGIAILLDWGLYKYFGINGIAWATVICVILAYAIISIVMSPIYKLWYLTIIFLAILLINLWIVSQSLKLGILVFVVTVIVNGGILLSLKDTENANK